MNHDYDSIAPFYDWVAGWTLAPTRRAIARLMATSYSGPVVDLGCGTGLQLVELKKQGLCAVGVDNSDAMLKVARRRLGVDSCVLSERAKLTIGEGNQDLNITDGRLKNYDENLNISAVDNNFMSLANKQPHMGCGSLCLIPTDAAQPCLIAASATKVPFPDNSFGLSLIALVLHESQDEPYKILDEALRLSSRAYVLDWAMAERNLDYPAHFGVRFIERLAGSRHYASYKRYIRYGALEGLISRYCKVRSVRVVSRRQLCLNTLLLIELERS